MTTEVLRNMIYARSPALDGLRFVVLDEVHYLQDRYRGAVWEEVIIHLPPEVRLVCLSATVSNAEEFAGWIETVRGRDRGGRSRSGDRCASSTCTSSGSGARDGPSAADVRHRAPDGEARPNPEAARLDRRR